MNETNIDLENINLIDTSIDSKFLDDDDDSFGSIQIKESSSHMKSDSDLDTVDDRNFNSKTGIIIDLSDTDTDFAADRIISANITEAGGINIEKNFGDESISDFDSYNSIDMETDYPDEDDDLVPQAPTDIAIEANEIHEAKAKPVADAGKVTANYWKDVAKKHAKSNKPGAYNTHFHLSGNPSLERELFNAAMMTGDHQGNICTTDLGGDTASIAGGEANSASGGFGESLESRATLNYTNQFRDLLDILNVEVIINSDKSLSVLDLCDDTVDFKCKTLDELRSALKPYMEDCFIYPLQIDTGLKFNDCAEWVNWYNNADIRKKYANLASDIDYCDVVANHLAECHMEDLI